MKFTKIRVPDFDLDKTLNSGQVFHWQKAGDGFLGTIGDRALYLEQRGEFLEVRFDGAPKSTREPRALPGLVARYLALDHPLAEICDSFPKDRVMNAARDFCDGLRIIRQPKWECLATFVCSSMKQVAHIRQMSQALREHFGTASEIEGHVLYTFPLAERVAASSEKELRECALGYRAANLLATARLIALGKVDLENWSELPDDALRANLCALPGVGPKVANCVMLFAYEPLRAFPIDVWIGRVLREQYFPRKRKVSAQQLRQFCAGNFGEHG